MSLTDPTLNGSQMSAQQTGMYGTQMGPLSGSGPVGGGVTGVDVTAGAGTQQQGGSFFKNADGSYNTDNIGLVMGGVQMLGNLWNSFQQHKIAKEQLGLARETFETNLANNRQTYNTALEDRIRARHNTEGKDNKQTKEYLKEHRL